MALPSAPSDTANYGLPAGGFQNYLVDASDPTTDQNAADYNRMAADCAQLTRVPLKARLTFTTNATTPVLGTYQAMWGISVPPTVTRSGAGVWDLTWPATVTDPLGATVATSLSFAIPSISGATYQQSPQWAVTAPNVVRVYTYSAGAAADIAGTVISVVAG